MSVFSRWSLIRSIWSALLLCIGCGYTVAQPVAAQPKPNTATPTYVGSNVCRTCHPDIAGTFYRNPHYKSIASGADPGPNVGCESCHGPGSAHIQAGGGKDTIPRAFSKLNPTQILDTCLTCHAESIPRANIRRSEHTTSDIVCTNCHSVHRSPAPKNLLKTEHQRDLCYGCHTTVRAQFSMPYKHRVNEGSAQCTDCHNPHGTFTPTWNMGTRPRMVDQVLGNEEPCLKCHIDKRGPFLYEHGAVRVDGCETCHAVHGSTNPRMLTRPIVAPLCLECHTGNGNFGRQANGITRQTPYHNVSSPAFQNCTSCHVRIHGSNADDHFFR